MQKRVQNKTQTTVAKHERLQNNHSGLAGSRTLPALPLPLRTLLAEPEPEPELEPEPEPELPRSRVKPKPEGPRIVPACEACPDGKL